MQCGCEIDSSWYDNGPSAFKRRDRKAVKKHRCYECFRDIEVGEIYRYESGIWDNGPSSYKTCMDCISLRDTFFCSYNYGELTEALSEHIDEAGDSVLTSNIAKLTDTAKERIFSMIEDQWEEFYLQNPTQPSVRLQGKMQKYPKSWDRPEWIKNRQREMYLLNCEIV